MPRATGNSPMARIMKDIYHRAAIKGQSTPHVLGLTASIINGKLLGKEKKREELEVLLQSSVFSPNISEPALNHPPLHRSDPNDTNRYYSHP